ncbi:hypothetical protein D3C71_1677670 [compost metagenome]
MPLLVADPGSQRLAVHFQVQGDAVVVDRRLVGVLYPHLHRHAQFQLLPGQRLDTDHADIDRVACLEQRTGPQAAGQQQDQEQAGVAVQTGSHGVRPCQSGRMGSVANTRRR